MFRSRPSLPAIIAVLAAALPTAACGTSSAEVPVAPDARLEVGPPAGDTAGGSPGRGGGAGEHDGGGGAAGGAGTGGRGGTLPGSGGAAAADAAAAVDGAAPPDLGAGGDTALSGPPRPARLIVLGDSIAACTNLGGIRQASCSAFKLHQHLDARHAPALVYENRAVGGAVTADVPARQLPGVTTGPGHALVLVYVGGNDLSRFLFTGDTVAERGFTAALPGLRAAWQEIFAFFGDGRRFPDGVTLVMNNQYNPFDGCTAPPFFLSRKKNELLTRFNAELVALAAAAGAHVLLVDQHTPYLGHGHHYDNRTCPNYKPGAAPWMDDLIHPNPAGHENLFQQWKALVDRRYQTGP